jgi:hypothetical protein
MFAPIKYYQTSSNAIFCEHNKLKDEERKECGQQTSLNKNMQSKHNAR